ncbi:hypothetical protein [Amycolatopsis sp. NPDC059020]|uniref:hypothetical protein n=1 Tax=unclassified Amycolatopsis TaxID=2618356 RepID=UPI00366BAD3F
MNYPKYGEYGEQWTRRPAPVWNPDIDVEGTLADEDHRESRHQAIVRQETDAPTATEKATEDLRIASLSLFAAEKAWTTLNRHDIAFVVAGLRSQLVFVLNLLKNSNPTPEGNR